jgi:CBS domain-containing protein
MSKLVRELMHPGVLTCQPNASLGQVAVLLAQHHIHALIVSDRDGRPLGIISDYDLLAGEWLSVDAESLDAMRKLTASDLMSYPVDTIEADMKLKDAAHILMEKDVNRRWQSSRRHFYL